MEVVGNTPDVDKPQLQVAPQVSEQATGVFSDRIVRMPLEAICGEHALVTEFERCLDLPYFPEPKAGCMPKDILRTLLGRAPILICKQGKNRDACIGNVRLFRLARIALDASELVPTIRYEGSLTENRCERLRQGLLVETFLLPAIFGRRAVDLDALSAAWGKATTAKMLDFWSGPESFAELYRSDPEPRKRKRGEHRG
jgi:hypothetical protein